MGFQTAVNINQAPAVAGDFCGANPRAAVLAGAEQLVAGSSGATVGAFGWMDSTSTLVSNAGTGVPDGFIGREMQATITQWLAQSSNLIQSGMPVTLYDQGDFWIKTSTAATVGQKVFASNTTGLAQTAAAGATVSGYTETKWVVASAGAANELIKITSWK